MNVSRNLWAVSEVEVLMDTINEEFKNGARTLYEACKVAATKIHRTAESCHMKYKYELDRIKRKRDKEYKDKKIVEEVEQIRGVDEAVKTVVNNIKSATEIRIPFKKMEVDPISREVVITF